MKKAKLHSLNILFFARQMVYSKTTSSNIWDNKFISEQQCQKLFLKDILYFIFLDFDWTSWLISVIDLKISGQNNFFPPGSLNNYSVCPLLRSERYFACFLTNIFCFVSDINFTVSLMTFPFHSSFPHFCLMLHFHLMLPTIRSNQGLLLLSWQIQNTIKLTEI